MNVLGIETTCDETAVAVVRDGHIILSNVISSHVSMQKQYGGVYPEMASRSHVDLLFPVIEEALNKSRLTSDDIDLLAVAHAPGLIGAILIGLTATKTLSLAWKKPFVGVNHIEAHLYSSMMGVSHLDTLFPALGVVISGGHTFLTKIHGIGKYEMLSTTVDDAIGEAFDKVARMLGLDYPGGPKIEELAKSGHDLAYPLKAGFVKKSPLHFSFSGLKTNVLYTLNALEKEATSQNSTISEKQKANLAASFQYTALMDIVRKSLKASQLFECKAIFVGGGVSLNQKLRGLFQEKAPTNLPVFYPQPLLCMDNGAMIAGLGYHLYQLKQSSDPLDLPAFPRLLP